MTRFLKYTFLFILLSLSPAKAGKVEIDAYHAGQGNCVLATFVPDNEDRTQVKHMLVDVGSSSYRKEMTWMKELEARDKSRAGKSPSPGEVISSSPEAESSREEEYKPSSEGELGEEIDTFLIQKLREKLEIESHFKESDREDSSQDESQQPPVSIHTVVITHPDKDHYGWLTKLFSQESESHTDHIEHLIFGGLPEHYDLSDSLKFRKWIQSRLQDRTKIYFPAISYNPITSLEDVLPSAERTYAPHRYSTPDSKIEDFGEAFNFGEGFNVDLLSVNPTHIEGRGGTSLRMSDDPGDDNADSLALRIGCGGSSMILTGDATNRTTTRIMNNYSDRPEFLRANVLLASHHGSSSHGSNNEAWIQATQPEVVLISNGLSQGHPHEEAYQIFKNSPRLKKAIPRGRIRGSKKHEVHTPEGRRETTYLKHRTKRAIFSTVTSFDIKVVLNEGGTIGLKTARGGDFDLMELTEEERLQEDAVVEVGDKPIKEEGKIILPDSSDQAENSASEDDEAVVTSMAVEDHAVVKVKSREASRAKKTKKTKKARSRQKKTSQQTKRKKKGKSKSYVTKADAMEVEAVPAEGRSSRKTKKRKRGKDGGAQEGVAKAKKRQKTS